VFRLVLVCIIFCSTLSACRDITPHDPVPPYYDPEAISPVNLPEERFKLVLPDQLESGNTVNGIYFRSVPPPFSQAVTFREQEFLLIVPNRNKLYHIDDKFNGKLISESGDGPNDIQRGMRLVPRNESLYLLQQGRVSIIQTDGDKVYPEVVFVKDHWMDSLGFLQNSNVVIDIYSPEGNQSMLILDDDFDEMKRAGRKLVHSSSSIVTEMGRTAFTQNNSGSLLLRFGRFSYAGIYDNSLRQIGAIHIPGMRGYRIEYSGGKAEVKLSPVPSGIFAVPGGNEDDIWISVTHRSLREGATGMFFDEYESAIDYYILSGGLELNYVGTSEHIMYPAGNKLFVNYDSGITILPFEETIQRSAEYRMPVKMPPGIPPLQ
jgi:hypothetical protein